MAISVATNASITLRGWERLENAFRVMPVQTSNAIASSLYKTATKVFNESQAQVPFRRGILSNSGFVSPPINLGAGQVMVRIGYGGAAAPYAYEQHYNLNYRHAPGRKALYLSDPVEVLAPSMMLTIQSDIGRMLTGLGF